jgi:hypothetical protein
MTAAFATIALGVATWGYAQAFATRPVTPVVLSGADIGFRVTGLKGNAPLGQLVIRVNGEWKEVEMGALGPLSLKEWRRGQKSVKPRHAGGGCTA